MTFISNLRFAFARTTGFLTLPVTTLLVLVYIAVAISTLITDELSPIPSTYTLQSRYGGLNVTEAYEDLHVIAARPHPYASHANDVVRDYLLQRVRDIQDHSGNLIIDDDVLSNGIWATERYGSAYGTYFEGNNILVKIRGTDTSSPPLPAILFSAHFDSVATASGAVDDGIGIITLLQLIKYFAAHPPLRTVLFNINNGEEDYLNGAHALLEHPWVKDTSNPEFIDLATFINVEGASSGGRPLLFRGTDIGALKIWKNVETPHANIITAEAFDLGFVRSGTDYTVYTSALAVPSPLDPTKFGPMRGLDFSFYRGRSKYHTKLDSVPYTEGGDKAIWAMLEPTWAAGVALANDDNTSSSEERAVYFELFNAVLVIFPLTYLLTFNITFLVAGPIALILLALSESALARSRAAKRQQATYSPSVVHPIEVETEESSASQVLSPSGTGVNEPAAQHEGAQTESKRSWKMPSFGVFWKHGRFWVALVLTIGAQVGLVAGFVNLNAFAVYGNPAVPILSSFTLAIVILSLVLSPPHLGSKIEVLSETPTTVNVPSWTSFRTLLTHNYAFSWLLLLASTVGITQFGLGGTSYMFSIWNGLVWLATAICGVAGCFGVAETAELEVVQEGGEEAHPTDDETEANERTPLVGRKRLRLVNKSKAGVDPVENPQPYVLWILVLLVLVPFPLIIVSHIALFLIPSMNQTLADGSSATAVYAAISLLSFVAALPVVPFIGARRVHRYLLWLLGLVWVVSTGLAWIPWSGAWTESTLGVRGGLFPFSEDAPLKVFFEQKVEVSRSNEKIVTVVTGAAPFLQDMIVPLLPSYLDSLAHGREVDCSTSSVDPKKDGLMRCSWETHNSGVASMDGHSMIPIASSAPVRSAGRNHSTLDWISTTNPWFQASAKSMSFDGSVADGARFFITGNNSRACRVYFDEPVAKFRVRTVDSISELLEDGEDDFAGWETQRGFGADSYDMLRQWSRDWGKTFVVDVQWSNSSSSSSSSTVGTQTVMSTDANGKRAHAGRVACEWVEYESGMVGMGLSNSLRPSPSGSGRRAPGAQIPAIEEMLNYLPKWAMVSKLTDGLVEAEEKFVL